MLHCSVYNSECAIHTSMYDNISQTLEFSSCVSCNELTLVSKQDDLKANNSHLVFWDTMTFFKKLKL